jgi:activator of HSP90 ATPase
MKTKTIHQSITLDATPHDVYDALIDSKKHADFTQSPAAISREVGGEFSTFDGWASGITIELIPERKIVQKWRGADWPQGYYSTVTFELREHSNKTILDFTQTGIPEDLYADLKDGWVEWYWDKLKVYFSQASRNGGK